MTGSKKETKLFVPKNNRFGLEYPSLNERWGKYMEYIQIRLNEVFFELSLEYFYTPSSKLMNFLEKNNFSSSKELFFKELFTNRFLFISDYSKEEFLYILDLFLQDYVKWGDFTKQFVGESDDYEQKDHLKALNNEREKLLNSFELFDLDYFWNKKTKQIERKIDEANTVVINENINKTSGDFGYQDCVDEFLKPRTEIDYLKSLDHLKRVFERVIQSKGVDALAKKKAVINLLFSGKTSDELDVQLTFIIKNIHHDQNSIPYKFTEQEYIYWWLEINKLIFILNSKS